jgi:hypothetical protein
MGRDNEGPDGKESAPGANSTTMFRNVIVDGTHNPSMSGHVDRITWAHRRHVAFGAACRDADAPLRTGHVPVRSNNRNGRTGIQPARFSWSVRVIARRCWNTSPNAVGTSVEAYNTAASGWSPGGGGCGSHRESTGPHARS